MQKRGASPPGSLSCRGWRVNLECRGSGTWWTIDNHGPATIVKELACYSLRYPSYGPGGNGMLKQQSKESPDTSISGLAASIASKLARNAAPTGDPPHPGASGLSEDSFSVDNQRRDEIPALQEIAPEMACPYPLRTNRTAEEYRGRADECLNWAREAPADEVRLACLMLATAWLKAAMAEDGGGRDHSPLAPKM